MRLLEDTPREKLLEEVAARIRGGLSYRELLAGLLLAGVKNIEPRPESASSSTPCWSSTRPTWPASPRPPEHRWLPIFWALDQYKSSAAADVRERGDWVMKPVDESKVTSGPRAARDFADAMDAWDEAAADAAIAGLARSAGAGAVYEQLFRYGMRDFRSIGHKAIYVANSMRTLESIGWHHAEPVLRSLAYALLMHEGDNPRDRDAEADRPFRRNAELVAKVREDWLGGAPDAAATTELLETLRNASADDACDQVVELLNRGAAPQSLWDALHLAAGELLMRQTGIVSLHAVTTTNALRYAYQASSDDHTRLLAMLQNAAFLTMFRKSMGSRGKIGDAKIDELGVEERSRGDDASRRCDLCRAQRRPRRRSADDAFAPALRAATPRSSSTRPACWCSSKATTPTTTSSAPRCSRTTTTCRLACATSTWPPMCITSATPASATTVSSSAHAKH